MAGAEDFRRSLEVLICCVGFLCLLQGQLMEDRSVSSGVNMNISSLEGRVCWSSMTRMEVGCPLDCCCCPLLATWLCGVGWMTWL